MKSKDGGYDSGYRAVSCFWGTNPSSLVAQYLSSGSCAPGIRVLDLGCGEGKNAAVFARLGASVDAIDCSKFAIDNGKRAFPDLDINWIHADVSSIDIPNDMYDVVIAYGLFHCLKSQGEIKFLISRAKLATRKDGTHIVCTFNTRSHDLSAHPGFCPLLMSHEWYLSLYSDWIVASQSDSDLIETHPHNGIEHHHSLTRILARRPDAPHMPTRA